MGNDTVNTTPTAIVFGASGVLGHALCEQFSVTRVVRCRNQYDSLVALDKVTDWNTTRIYDLAWHGSRTPADRANAEMQRESYWQFAFRVRRANDLSRGRARYIAVGSWVEAFDTRERDRQFSRDGWATTSEHQGSPYAHYKRLASLELLASQMSALWIRLQGVLHMGLPPESLPVRGARNAAVVHPRSIWHPLPLDTVAQAIARCWNSPTGIINLAGEAMTMSELVQHTGGAVVCDETAPLVNICIDSDTLAPFLRDHAPRERVVAMLAEYGEKWRER